MADPVKRLEALLSGQVDQAFARAVRTVLRHEGGFVEDPADPGGATRYGISLAYLRQLSPELGLELGDVDQDGDLDAEDIRALPLERAVTIYRRQWWERYRYDRLPTPIGVKVFDLAVNMGPRQAHKLAQRAVRAAGAAPIAVDGVIGPNTREALEAVPTQAYLAGLRAEAAGFYRGLVIADASRERFLEGWLNRAYE